MIEDSLESETTVTLLESEIEQAPISEPKGDGVEDVEAPPRPADKPDISHLPDAVQLIDGVWTLMVGKGDLLVIDYSALPFGAWMDTKCWMIDSVREDGFLGLWDRYLQQFGCTDWRRGRERGLVFKVALNNEWKTPRRSAVSRNSPKRNAVLAHMAKDAGGSKAEAPKEKRTGRPKGKLNKKTIARLAERGLDAGKMTREEVDAAMAKIRKEEYEAAKAERRRQREAKDTNKGKVA